MSTWSSILALTVVGAMTTTMAFAQGSSGAGSGASADSTKPGSMQSDSMKSDSMKKSDGMKSDSMKSDSMKKSDGMKSDSMKSDSMKAGKGGNRERVKAAQQALKDKGHDPGAPDGIMGAKTQGALRDFQKAEGLKETGRLDAETLSKLGVQASAGSSSSPSASPQTGSGSSSTMPPAGSKDAPASKDKGSASK